MSAPARYQLLEPIARGGMGEIWLAQLRGAAGFEKRVVIKRVLSHLDDDPEFLARFIDEARIAATLSHANIVSVFDLGDDDDGFFLAMEWVDGWDLRRILRTLAAEGERIPDPLALFVAAELAGALAYAHAREDDAGAPLRIVHRDVSPANVLVSRTGDVKLTDFGIASARSRLGRTETGQLRGKFAYMSPEQASGSPVDGRSDVFALGALLFEMLTGEKAFAADGDIATLERVRNGDRPALGTLRPDLPDSVVAVVDRALAVDPATRFDGASDMESHLRAAMAEHWGVVGRGELAAWIEERLRTDPLFRVQSRPGGASLDDILAAQLDGANPSGSSNTGSATGPSRSATRSAARAVGGASRHRPAASRTGGHTMTRAAVPPARRPSARLWVLVATLAIVVGGAAVAAIFWPAPPRVVVHSEPPGAQVYVDGVPYGVSDLRARVAPGPHEVRLSLPGFRAATREIEARRGEVEQIRVVLEPADRPIAFNSVPAGALVTVGETQIVAGNSLPVPIGVPVRVRMDLDGYRPIDREVVFDAGDTVHTMRLEPLPTEEPPAAGPSDGEPGGDGPDGRSVRTPADGPAARSDDGGRPRSNGSGTVPAPEAVPTGTLVIRFTDPPLVGDITIDGQPYGSNEDVRMEFQLAAGRHTIGVVNTIAGVRFEAGIELEPGVEQAVTVDWSEDG